MTAVALLCAAGLSGKAQRTPEPLFGPTIGPLRTTTPAGLRGIDASDCARCHGDAHAGWTSSAHARGLANPIYRAEVAHVRGGGACVGCHSPRAEVTAGDPGVDCATCHVRDGAVLTARAVDTSAHPTRVDARLTDGELCASCHQFDFADMGTGHHERFVATEAVQDTVAEWRRSRAAAEGRGCTDCHMRPGSSHAFEGFGAWPENTVRVSVTARREANGTRIDAVLTPGSALGHAFPTGDMFRQAVLTVRHGGREESLVLRRYFGTVSEEAPDGSVTFHVGEIDDTRLMPAPAPPRRWTTTLPAAPGPVHWRLDLHRLDPSVAERRELRDSRVRLAAGRATVR